MPHRAASVLSFGHLLLSVLLRADEQQHQPSPEHHSRDVLGRRRAPRSDIILGAPPPRLQSEDDMHGLGSPGRTSVTRAIDGTLAFCKHHGMSLFITCPVADVERATAFYTAIGWTLNPEMSDDNVSCFAIAPEQYVMLGSREMYASVGGVDELVGGPDTPSKVTVSFDLDSREAVDALIERARAAGGRVGDTDDYPFMYQRQFDDPDGYHYSPFWMKPDVDRAS